MYLVKALRLFVGTAAERTAAGLNAFLPGDEYHETDTEDTFQHDGMAWIQKNIIDGISSTSSEIVVNNEEGDRNFRIAGNGVTNGIYYDAGNNRTGFGTPAPAGGIHLLNSGFTPLIVERDSGDFAQGIEFRKSRGGSGVLSGNQLARLRTVGELDTGAYPTASTNQDMIAAYATENFTATGQGRDIRFYIVPTGTVSAALAMSLQNGIQVGTPTGGYKGTGTANFAGDIYKNNSAFTNPDYALEYWRDGRVIQHARKAGAINYRRLSLNEVENHIRENLKLPGFDDKPLGMFGRGDLLLEKIEELYTHIIELNHKLEVRDGKGD